MDTSPSCFVALMKLASSFDDPSTPKETMVALARKIGAPAISLCRRKGTTPQYNSMAVIVLQSLLPLFPNKAADALSDIVQVVPKKEVSYTEQPAGVSRSVALPQITDEDIALHKSADAFSFFERASQLFAEEKFHDSERLLRIFLRHRPTDPNGHATLSMCLDKLEQLELALMHMRFAAVANGHSPTYHWNAASFAHRLDYQGCCYLSLLGYLSLKDKSSTAKERRQLATGYIEEYESLAVLEHPHSTPRQVAVSEEMIVIGKISSQNDYKDLLRPTASGSWKPVSA